MTVWRQYVSVYLDVVAACVDNFVAQQRTAWLKCWIEWRSVELHHCVSILRLRNALVQHW